MFQGNVQQDAHEFFLEHLGPDSLTGRGGVSAIHHDPQMTWGGVAVFRASRDLGARYMNQLHDEMLKLHQVLRDVESCILTHGCFQYFLLELHSWTMKLSCWPT